MVLMTYFFRKSFELYLISSFLLRFRPYFDYYCFLLLPSKGSGFQRRPGCKIRKPGY